MTILKMISIDNKKEEKKMKSQYVTKYVTIAAG